jgi:hypothetical protein
MAEEKSNANLAESENIEVNLDFEILHYSIDKDGNWDRKMLANWGHKEIVNTQTWIVVQERLNAAKEDVLSGKSSPIAYHMTRCVMDPKLCGEFVGLSKRKVKKHMKPAVFDKLSPDILKRYADAFEISVEELVGLKEKLKQQTKTEV